MTTSCLPAVAQPLRSAVETDDYGGAESSLAEFIAWFHSERRTLQEVESAKRLFEGLVESAKVQRARIAEELALLMKFSDSYVPPRSCHTWRLDG